MFFEFSKEEVKTLIGSLREAAASCNTFISHAEFQGYTKQAVYSESKRLKQIWDMIERLETGNKKVKPPGSTGTIDPYDFSDED